MNDRIVKLMRAEGLTNSKFASILGIQRSNITHIIDGRNKPSLSFIEKLIAKFPRVNIEWLITGIGEMYKRNEAYNQKSGQKKDDSPTLFPEVTTTQITNNQKENHTALQSVKQEINEVTDVANIPTEHKLEQKSKPELKIETQVQLEKETKKMKENKISFSQNNADNLQNPKQLTTPEPDSTEQIKEREIECVLIFHSDKTFKYYKPE